MKKAAIKFRSGIRWFDTWLARVASWIAVVMMVTIVYDVFMRYVFGMPTKWSFEFNEYFLLAIVYFSGAWTLPAGGHVNIDILYRRLSQRRQAIIELVTCSMGIIFTAMLAWQAALFTYDGLVTGTRSSEFMAVLQWPIRSFMVIGASLLCLEFIFRLSHYTGILGSREKKEEV